MDKLFVCLAVALAKAVTFLIQLTGLGMASSLPGKLAYKIYPNILPYLAKQLSAGCLAITGTNGKSTTAGLLASILEKANYQVIHNKQGANLIPGIITAFIRCASWNGNLKGNFGLLEVDEAALPLLAKQINCQIIVVTNLFRDQLDRYGELDKTARLITQGIQERSSLALLNADDPNVCNLPCTGKKNFYGVNQNLAQANANLEISYCPKCGHEINYSSEKSFNIWYCPNCGYKRPNPDLFVDQIKLMSSVSKFVVHTHDASIAVDLPLPGIFNIYNAAAASAAAYCLGINLEIIKQGLEKYETLFGRSEKLSINGRNVIIQLIKNPAGASKSLESLVNSDCSKVLIAINDNYADGRDVSWLWDANFEILTQMKVDYIVSGNRAQDMAVRLKYASVNAEKISCISNLSSALNQAVKEIQPNETLWILPTYTALLELQNITKIHKNNEMRN